MASRQQLETALRNAHAAGDMEAARRLAGALKGQTGAAPAVQPDPGITGRGVASSALKGLSFGFGDRIVAGMGAIPAALTTGTSIPEAYSGIRDIVREETAAFEADNPGVSLASEIGGGLLGGTGLVKAGMAIPKTVGGVMGQAGLLGGVYGAGTSEKEGLGLLGDVAKSAVLTGLTGGALPAIGAGLSKVATKVVQPAASKAYRAAVDKLQDAGIELTTGQKVGSNPIKAVEGSLGSTLLGGEIGKTMSAGRDQFQRKLMSMAGFSKDDISEGLITAESLSNAGNNLSKEYTEALGGKTVNLLADSGKKQDINTSKEIAELFKSGLLEGAGDDLPKKFVSSLIKKAIKPPNFSDALNAISKKHSELLTPLQRRSVDEIVDSFREQINQPISGQRYQELRSQLGNLQRSSRDHVSDLYGDLKRALDDQFANSVEIAAGFTKKDLDKRYAQYKQLDTIYNRTGGQEVSAGVLPLASLNRLAKKSPGSKEWKELVNSASQVLSSKTPDSKTASHLLNLTLAGGTGALLANPATAVGTLGTGALLYGAGKALGKGLTPQINQAAQQNLGKLGLLSVPGVQASAAEAGLLR